MSLEHKLSQIREASAGRIPPEKREVMLRETQKLRDSGILSNTIQVGDPLPAFELENEHNELGRSAELLQTGGIVLTVFRGHW